MPHVEKPKTDPNELPYSERVDMALEAYNLANADKTRDFVSLKSSQTAWCILGDPLWTSERCNVKQQANESMQRLSPVEEDVLTVVQALRQKWRKIKDVCTPSRFGAQEMRKLA